MHNPTNPTPDDGTQTTFHIRPRVCMSEGGHGDGQFYWNFFVSLSVPLPAPFGFCNAPTAKTIEVDFFIRFFTTIPSKSHIITLLPENGNYAQVEFRIASSPCLQKTSSISIFLLKNWQRNPTSSGFKTAIIQIMPTQYHPTCNILPTMQNTPNLHHVFLG